jgi:hypothetical protein
MFEVDYTTLNPLACVQVKEKITQYMVSDGAGGYVGLGLATSPYKETSFMAIARRFDFSLPNEMPYFMALCEAGTDAFTNFSCYTSAGDESFKPRGAIHISGESEYKEFANATGRPDLLTNQVLVSTELAFDAAYFIWLTHNLSSLCPIRTVVVNSFGPDYEMNPPVCDRFVLGQMNDITGKNADWEVVESYFRFCDRLQTIKTTSERRRTNEEKAGIFKKTDGTSLKAVFEKAARNSPYDH